MHFDRLSLIRPIRRWEMPYFEMEYGPRWQALKNFIQEVNLKGEIVDSKVSFRTIAYFAPSLKRWETEFEEVSGRGRRNGGRYDRPAERVRTRRPR